jgi:RNA polymerase sigma factor (sigma-70 family)
MRTRLLRAAELHEQSEAPVAVPQPDEAIIELQRKAQIDYALEQLGGKCRELLTEIFYASRETSYKDIAHRLGIPMNSLGPTRMRCLAKLKKILTDLGYE